MPDFLRPFVYPLLLTSIVGSLWLLATSEHELAVARLATGRPLPSQAHFQVDDDRGSDGIGITKSPGPTDAAASSVAASNDPDDARP